MAQTGFDGKVRTEQLSVGRWLLIFAAGDTAWWMAWFAICDWTRAGALLSAIMFPIPLLAGRWIFVSLAIDLAPVVATSAIAYRLRFEDRSGWSIYVWILAGYALSNLTRFLSLFLL